MTLPNKSVEKFDRLIDWETSLTPRDTFLDAVASTEQLRIKYGADITASTLHLGHAANLRVMREMQKRGHKVVFLLGGFTTLIGDPTDRLHARAAVDEKSLEENKKLFIDQVGTVLDFDNPDGIEIRDNTEWWGDAEHPGTISQYDLFRLLGRVSHSLLASRSMFKKRAQQGEPTQMSEFLYPVLQGYDSVMVDSDVTVVGTDQLFNESMGRLFQKDAGQPEQMIVCTKITPGLDGGPKQSKSIGNFVGIAHSPQEKFNRLMRLRDDLTGQWLRVYSELPLSAIEDLEKQYAGDPLALKRILAYNVTHAFHGEEAADRAREEFERKLTRQIPTDIPEVNVQPGTTLRDVLMRLGHRAGAIRQFIDAGSVSTLQSADGEQPAEVLPTHETIRETVTPGTIVRVGKRYFRIASE